MANALKVALKNQAGQYLMPYTNNLPVDESPVIGSENYLKSGAVAQALRDKENAGAVNSHNADANAHTGKFDPAGTAAGAVSGHVNDQNAHAGRFDPAGTAAGAVSGHVNDPNPHYGKFDPAGTAAGAVSNHNADANAHAGRFDPAGTAANAVSGHVNDQNPHAGKFDPAGAAAGAVSNHNADANAHAALFAGNLKNPIAIPEGANLNDYFAPGVYIAYTDTIAASVLNSATQFAFTLIVLKTAGSANGNIQIQMDYANQTIQKRTYGYDWVPWKKILCTEDAGIRFPDYANGINIASGHVTTQPGWIMWTGIQGNNLFFNGLHVAHAGDSGRSIVELPVPTGTTITFGADFCNFIPMA